MSDFRVPGGPDNNEALPFDQSDPNEAPVQNIADEIDRPVEPTQQSRAQRSMQPPGPPASDDDAPFQVEAGLPSGAQEERRSGILQLLDEAGYPGEEGMARMGAALHVADRLDMDPTYVWNNWDTVTEELTGAKRAPEQWARSVMNANRAGNITNEIGILRYQQMAGDTSEETQQRIDELWESMPDPDETERGFIVNGMQFLAEQVPLWREGLERGLQQGMAGGAGALAAGAVAGVPLVAGPQAILGAPAYVASLAGVTLAGFAVGQRAGASQAINEIEAGMIYDTILRMADDNGVQVDPQVARAASLASGPVAAALETLQVDKIPGLNRIAGRITREGIARTLVNRALPNTVFRAVAGVVAGTGEQVAQEVFQEATAVIAEEVSKQITNETRGGQFERDGEEIAGRLRETAVQTASGFGFLESMKGISRIGSGARAAQQERRSTQNAETAATEAEAAAISDEINQMDLNERQEELNRREREAQALLNVNPEQAAIEMVAVEEERAILERDQKARSHPRTNMTERQPWQMTTTEYEARGTGSAAPAYAERHWSMSPAGQAWKSQIRERFGDYSDQELDSTLFLVEIAAGQAGMDPDVYMEADFGGQAIASDRQTRLREGELFEKFKLAHPDMPQDQLEYRFDQQVKGAANPGVLADLYDGRAMVYLMDRADESTLVHEMGHIVRKRLSPELRGRADQLYEVVDGAWSTQQEEQFARDWEEYWRQGVAPSEEHRSVFQELARFMRRVYDTVVSKSNLTAEKRALFDEMVKRAPMEPADIANQGAGRIATDPYEVTEVAGEVTQVTQQETEVTPGLARDSQSNTPFPVVEFPLDQISQEDGVQQFKEGADATGVVDPLKSSEYKRLGTAPIVVWESEDGTYYTATGRHRAQLARDLGEQTIPAQVIREADGYSLEDAQRLDAESNIRDGQGTVRDYVKYFRGAQDLDWKTALQEGLLSREQGRRGYWIGRNSGEALYTLYANEEIGAGRAAAIASGAPNNDAAQRAAITQQRAMNEEELHNYAKYLAEGPQEEAAQTDMFGSDDSVMEQAATIARRAASASRAIKDEISVLRKARNLSTEKARDTLKRVLGDSASFTDSVEQWNAINKRIVQLTAAQERMAGWTQDPEIGQWLRDGAEGDNPAMQALEQYTEDTDQDTLFQLADEQKTIVDNYIAELEGPDRVLEMYESPLPPERDTPAHRRFREKSIERRKKQTEAELNLLRAIRDAGSLEGIVMRQSFNEERWQMAHRSTRPGVEWQLSYFDYLPSVKDNVPTGHTEYDSFERMLNEVLNSTQSYDKTTVVPETWSADPDILFQETAWHGSPHLFDQFSLEHIGAGEGAQAFGWGLYFSGNENVARDYAKRLNRPRVPMLKVGDSIVYQDDGIIADAVVDFYANIEDRSIDAARQKMISDAQEAYRITDNTAYADVVEFFSDDERWNTTSLPDDMWRQSPRNTEAANRIVSLLDKYEEKHGSVDGDEGIFLQDYLHRNLMESASLQMAERMRRRRAISNAADFEQSIRRNIARTAEDTELSAQERKARFDAYEAALDIIDQFAIGLENESINVGDVAGEQQEVNRKLYRVTLNEGMDDKWLEWYGRIPSEIIPGILGDDYQDAARYSELTYRAMDAEIGSAEYENAVTEQRQLREQNPKITKLAGVIDGNGEQLYSLLMDRLGSPKAASQWLNNRGYTGIKYPVQGSTRRDYGRGANYVMFDDAHIRIDDTILFQEVGEKAVLSDGQSQSLAEAKRMAERGVHADQIKNQTGWTQHQGGRWRYELPAANMQLRPDFEAIDGKFNGKLDQLMAAQELFDAYPILRSLQVRARVALDAPSKGIMEADDGLFSSPDPANDVRTGGITVYAQAADADSLMNVVQHTVQKVIERIEQYEGETIGVAPGEIDARLAKAPADASDQMTLFQEAAPTDSQEFKSWFKESKVVDHAGKPLEVYHGSPSAGFGEFNTVGSDASKDTGAWFTDKPLTARSYSGSRDFITPETVDQQLSSLERRENTFGEITWQSDESEIVIYEPGDGSDYWVGEYDGDNIAEGDTRAEVEEQLRDELERTDRIAPTGPANYEVYLSLQNPEIIDADGRNWDQIIVEEGYMALDETGAELEYFTNKEDAEHFRAGSDEYVEIVEDNFPGSEWTTNDYVRWVKENTDADGVIIENVIDSGGLADSGESTVYVAFYPEQIKSRYNRGTWDPQDSHILFQTDLAAFHGTTSEKLAKALDLGGMPMPSIAIRPGAYGYSDFGSITLIGDRKLIDPERDQDNLVYTADAYTPRTPPISWKAEKGELLELTRRLDEIDKEVPPNRRGMRPTYHDDLDMYISSPDALADRLNRHVGVQIMWLRDEKRIDYTVPLETVQVPADKAEYDRRISAWWDARREKQTPAREYPFEVWEREQGLEPIEMIDVQEFEPNVHSEYFDQYRAEYESWLRSWSRRFFRDPRVKVGKKQMPATLENLVDAMSRGATIGAEESMVYGAGNARAETSERLKSVEEMHARESTLAPNDEAQAHWNDVVKPAAERFIEAAYEAYGWEDIPDLSTWDLRNDAHRALGMYLKRGSKRRSPDRMRSVLTSIFGPEGVDATLEPALEAAHTIADAPVKYFEAKPKRAIRMNEFKSAVVPAELAPDMKERLKAEGITLYEYDDNTSRDDVVRRALADQPDVLFQDEGDYQSPRHETVVERAVESGFFVPYEVLKEYATRPWAIEELEYREAAKQEAKEFATADEYVEYAQAMDMEPRSTEYYRSLYDGAPRLSYAEENRKWVASLDKSTVSGYLFEVLERGEVESLPHAILQTGAKRLKKGQQLSDAHYKKIIDQIRDNPGEYRELFAGVTQDNEILQQIEIERILDPTADEIEQLRAKNRELRRKNKKLDTDYDSLFVTLGSYRSWLENEEKKVASLQEDVKRAESNLKSAQKEATADKKSGIAPYQDALRSAQQEAQLDSAAAKAPYADAIRSAKQEARKSELQQRRRLVAEAKERVVSAKQEMRELYRYRAQVERQIKRITAKPAGTIDYQYARQIQEIQATLRIGSLSQKKHNQLQNVLGEIGNAEIRQIIESELKRQDLKKLSPKALDELDQEIGQLRNEGRKVRAEKMAQEQLVRQEARNAVVEAITKGEGVKALQAYGSRETTKELKRGRIPIAFLNTLRPERLWRAMGGGEGNPLYKWLWEEINEATDAELRAIDQRVMEGESEMRRLGITPSRLGELINIAGHSYTRDQVIHMYIAMQDQDSAAAVQHGNNIPLPVINQYISKLSREDKSWGDWMINSFGEENFQRIQEVLIKTQNQGMTKVLRYFPMLRRDYTYQDFKEEVADAMLRTTWAGKATVPKKFSISRIKIAPRNQKAIKLGATSVWRDQTQKQEKFIHSAELVKRLNAIFHDRDVQKSLVQEFGPSANKIVDKYVNDFTNPNIYAAHDDMGKMMRILRSNFAVAVLAYNATTVLKQLPSSILYLSEVDPAHLISAWGQFLTKPKTTMKFVEDLDPQVKARTMNRYMEELKQIDYERYEQIIQKVGNIGFMGISAADKMAVTIGWKAVYDMKRWQKFSPEEAAKAAQLATLRTQPAARAKDLAAIYRTEKGLAWFTMFSNQLNQIFNLSTYDLYDSVKRGNAAKAFGIVAGIGLNSVAMGTIARKGIWENDDDEPEDKAATAGKDLLQQLLSAVPVFGGGVVSGLQGYGFMRGVDPFPFAYNIGAVLRSLEDGSIDMSDIKTTIRLLESAGTAAGLPTVAARRVRNVFLDEELQWDDIDPWELIGGAPEE